MHSPTNCYLVSLAAADCVVLIASVPNEILSYYVIGSQWIWGPIGCAVFVFLQNLGRQKNKKFN
jgi:thyrotropin-releasing hormone receptor